jgi:hypothetical protein
MSMRFTRGCGNLGVASHAWVVFQFRRLKKGSKLTGINGTSAEWRLVGGARQTWIKPASGIPIVSNHGIYLVYARYIFFRLIYQVYFWYIPGA